MADTSEPALKLSETKGTTGTTIETENLDGTWKVVPGTSPDETVAGYRVKEVFLAGSRKATANGRTNDVTGNLTVTGGNVLAGEFTVDMTTLASDQGQRDNQLKQRGLQTDQFPTATFKLTKPITLPTEIPDGNAGMLEVEDNGSLEFIVNFRKDASG